MKKNFSDAPLNDAFPNYQRHLPAFHTVLGASAERVISAMDEAGDDIPYQTPAIKLSLPRVGLNRQHVPVRIADPFGSGTTVQLSCDVQLRTFVPDDKRGIHTSRIGQTLTQCVQRSYSNLQEFAATLAQEIHRVEYGKLSEVQVAGVLAYTEAVPGWNSEKDKTSLEHLGMHARVLVEDKRQVEHAGITFNHITACPCVQQTYKHALQEAKGDVGAALDTVAPLLTHSQRCQTRIEIKNLEGPLPTAAILETLDQLVYRVQNTLPREYELLLVYRAHQAPQFIEDAVRQILGGLYRLLGASMPASAVQLHSVSMESIHDYDIVAEIELPFEEIGKALTEPA